VIPRVPFVLAEHHVAYTDILAHIDSRRAAVEKAAGPTARRIAWLCVHKPLRPAGVQDRLARQLERTLMQTASFGYRQARAEVGSLRAGKPAPAAVARLFPDAGRHGAIAVGGLDTIRAHVRQRAHVVAAEVAAAARLAADTADKKLPVAVRVAAAQLAASRVLHNAALELVGETLNLGRTAGVASLQQPPQFAMRSEQLDANTCDSCEGLHGEIVEIGSADYYELMPPSGCDGGGRCRGIYVYGDEPVELEQAA